LAKNDASASGNQIQNVREHLANERTYLAYLRTSLALVSLGISVNRFALYLLERNKMSPTSTTGQTLVGAEQLGIGMAVIGLVLLVWGTLHYTIVYRQIGRQDFHPSLVAIWVLSAIVFVASLGGFAWLFTR
jgi:putative membrane protein